MNKIGCFDEEGLHGWGQREEKTPLYIPLDLEPHNCQFITYLKIKQQIIIIIRGAGHGTPGLYEC